MTGGEPAATRDGAPTGRAVRGGAPVAVAMVVMNLSTYGYTMLAAHFLGPERYSGFVAVLNLLLVLSVASLGLQATAARRIAADPDHVAQIQRSVLRVTWRLALSLGVVLLLAAPLVDRLLGLADVRLAVLVAVGAVPLTLVGGQTGTLQGERRWQALGWLYVAAGLPRLVIGTLLLTWQPTELLATTAVVAGFVAPTLVGWWALRGGREPGPTHHDHRFLAVVGESAHSSQALLAYFALSNADIIVARHVMGPHDAGLYAAGLIITKALLFLPQFVVVVAFPSLSTPSRRSRTLLGALGVVGMLGSVGVLTAWLLPGPALLLAGGTEFARVGPLLGLFAALGAVLSMLQLLVYALLARRGRAGVLLVWVALLVLAVLGAGTSTPAGLVAVALAVDGVLLLALLPAAVRDRQRLSGPPRASSVQSRPTRRAAR